MLPMPRMTRAVLAVSVVVGAQNASPPPADQKVAAPVSSVPIAVSTRYPAVDPPAPALVYAGGHFLRHPRVVTITWKGDDDTLVSRLEVFGASITRGAWWSTVTAGLCARAGDCMGPGGEASSVRLGEPFPGNATLAGTGVVRGRVRAGCSSWRSQLFRLRVRPA